jgi:hypothetical protein
MLGSVAIFHRSSKGHSHRSTKGGPKRIAFVERRLSRDVRQIALKFFFHTTRYRAAVFTKWFVSFKLHLVRGTTMRPSLHALVPQSPPPLRGANMLVHACLFKPAPGRSCLLISDLVAERKSRHKQATFQETHYFFINIRSCRKKTNISSQLQKKGDELSVHGGDIHSSQVAAAFKLLLYNVKSDH